LVQSNPNRPKSEECISEFDKDEIEIQKWRRGEIEFGKPTGFPALDPYFLWKMGEVTIVNGFSGVGKTVLLMYLFYKAAVLYKWRICVFSSENKPSFLKIKLMEYFINKKLRRFNDEEYEMAKKFVTNHFIFIDINRLYTSFDLIGIFEDINNKTPLDLVFIDPYNSLLIPDKKTPYIHHSETAGALRVFAQSTNAIVVVNMHPYTLAARQVDKEGFAVVPRAEDSESGVLWLNRADNFLTLHRLKNHPIRWPYTELHVRKIKTLELGGGYTEGANPVLFKMEMGGTMFTDSCNTISGNSSAFDADEDTYVPF